jgi:transposase-like protein
MTIHRRGQPRADHGIELNGSIDFRGKYSHMRWLTTAFLKKFPDDDACWRQLEKVGWPDGPVCAKCGNVGPTMACGRKHYHQCKACNAKFTAAFGTPLKGTHLPMQTCFTALYLLAVSSKGLSSVALGRHLGVGQKTAWFLGHRIRAMMGGQDRASASPCPSRPNVRRWQAQAGRCHQVRNVEHQGHDAQPELGRELGEQGHAFGFVLVPIVETRIGDTWLLP